MARRISILRSSFLRMAGSVLSAVMTALGVSSCGGTNPVTPCYGVQAVDITVGGNVFWERDSSAIGGIRVMLSTIQSTDTTFVDSVYTSESGVYGFNFIQEGEVDYNDYALYIQADDVDSILNGLYLSQDTLIPVTPDSVADHMVNVVGLNFYLDRIAAR